MPSDSHKFVIHADQTPASEYVKRYNALFIEEVSIVMIGEEFHLCDILLRNEQLQ